MAVLPNADGVLLLLFTMCCTSPRDALFYLLLLSVLLAVTRLFASLLRRLSLPFSAGGAMLFSLSVGATLCLLLQAWHTDAPSPAEPTTVAVLLTAGLFSRTDTVPSMRLLPFALIVGALREGLTHGTLWGVTVIAPLLSGETSGLLIGALLLGLFGLRCSVFSSAPRERGLTAVLLTVLGGTIGLITPAWPPLYAVWVAALAVCLVDSLLPAPYAAENWLPIAALAALFTRQASWWMPLLLAGCAAIGVTAIAAVCRRLRLSDTPRRFAGAPVALTVVAIMQSVSTVF